MFPLALLCWYYLGNYLGLFVAGSREVLLECPFDHLCNRVEVSMKTNFSGEIRMCSWRMRAGSRLETLLLALRSL